MKRVMIGLLGLMLLAGLVRAQEGQVKTLTLPALFTDHMVLQQGKPVSVWGWAPVNANVSVQIAGQSKAATAGADGKWLLKLDPLSAGGPHEMTIAASDSKLSIKDVLVGEVWVCSGQSNMEWSLRNSNGGAEAAAASKNSQIRLFTVPKKPTATPASDVKGQWVECNETTTPNFSGVGYFFGRELQQALNVPVGLIHTSWGGTPIQHWQSRAALEGDPEYAALLKSHDEYMQKYPEIKKKFEADLAKAKAEGKTGNQLPRAPRQPDLGPSTLFNGMVAPLTPYTIGGAIWYQGESNAGQAMLYRRQMPDMIKEWRKAFDSGEFPFMITQLANFMKREDQPSDPGWAYLREAQLLSAQKTPKTGMAVIIDIGEANDIHPRNKEDVGKRLCLAALGIGYGKSIVYSGPEYASMKVEGDKVRLSFKHVGGGLVAKGEKLTGFAIAGEDKKFVWADAKIDGDTIVVSANGVAKPVAVRYAWANNPECNLYNKEGLPATPFRTDDWVPGK